MVLLGTHGGLIINLNLSAIPSAIPRHAGENRNPVGERWTLWHSGLQAAPTPVNLFLTGIN
jgi:hypothetical protein